MQRLDFLVHFYQLLFAPDALVEASLSRDKGMSRDQASRSVEKLRKHVLRALKVVLAVVVFTGILHLVLDRLGIHIPHTWLIGMKVIGYSLILWGVLSPLGYPIQTMDGETLPEIVDEEWHKFVYLVGLFLLLLSYLSEL
jgi:hypothetical protein